MDFENGVLTINPEMTFNEIKDLNEFVKQNLEEIDSINLEEDKNMANSSIIALILSAKIQKPTLNIPFNDKGMSKINGIGRTVLINNNTQ